MYHRVTVNSDRQALLLRSEVRIAAFWHGVAAGPRGTRVDDGRRPGYIVVSAEFKQVVDIGEFDR
ncbi:hypothetical protein Ait01nite_062690 [Actinoplanes italicus]|nr:hypothetical protein Ait01nite_062690 [Actinoplanes italicus]